MKGYRKLRIKPGVPELAAQRKKQEDDRRFMRALRDLQAQRQSATTTPEVAGSVEAQPEEEGKNE